MIPLITTPDMGLKRSKIDPNILLHHNQYIPTKHPIIVIYGTQHFGCLVPKNFLSKRCVKLICYFFVVMEVKINFADVSPVGNSLFRVLDRIWFQLIEGPHKQQLDRFHFSSAKDFNGNMIFKDKSKGRNSDIFYFMFFLTQSLLRTYSMCTVLFYMKAIHFELYDTLYFDCPILKSFNYCNTHYHVSSVVTLHGRMTLVGKFKFLC